MQSQPILFIIPGACSLGSQITLEYLEIPYQISITTKEIRSSEAFHAVNPIGRVGALKDGNIVVAENTAILLYLTDKYDINGTLAHKNDLALRAKVYQWLSYSAATLHVSLSQALFAERLIASECVDQFKQDANKRSWEVLSYINSHLETNKYFIGDNPSIVDFQSYGILRWTKSGASKLGITDLGREFANISRFFADVERLPKLQNALAIEQQQADNLVDSKFAGYFTL